MESHLRETKESRGYDARWSFWGRGGDVAMGVGESAWGDGVAWCGCVVTGVGWVYLCGCVW